MSGAKAVYRNSQGCCICGTKSSSSRFTHSKRYESTFEDCFRVSCKERSGMICNSCVLIVKRFRKNPYKLCGVKDWSHKIDSRIGPGSKPKAHRRYPGVSTAVSSNSNSRCSSPPRSNRRMVTGRLPVPHRKTSEAVSLRMGTGGRVKKLQVSGSAKRKAFVVNRRFTNFAEDLHYYMDPFVKQPVRLYGVDEYVGEHGNILTVIPPLITSPSQVHISHVASLSTASLDSPALGSPLEDEEEEDAMLEEEDAMLVDSGDHNRDATRRLLAEVSFCLSELDENSDKVGTETEGWGKTSLKVRGQNSEESSGIESRADSDPGDISPPSVRSRVSEEEF